MEDEKFRDADRQEMNPVREGASKQLASVED